MTRMEVRNKRDSTVRECPLHEAGDLLSSGEWVMVRMIDVPVVVTDVPETTKAAAGKKAPTVPATVPALDEEIEDGDDKPDTGRRPRRAKA